MHMHAGWGGVGRTGKDNFGESVGWVNGSGVHDQDLWDGGRMGWMGEGMCMYAVYMQVCTIILLVGFRGYRTCGRRSMCLFLPQLYMFDAGDVTSHWTAMRLIHSFSVLHTISKRSQAYATQYTRGIFLRSQSQPQHQPGCGPVNKGKVLLTVKTQR